MKRTLRELWELSEIGKHVNLCENSRLKWVPDMSVADCLSSAPLQNVLF